MSLFVPALAFASSSHPDVANESYRFAEHCLFADREHIILGTCIESLSPKDEHERNLICKGQNEPVFIITSKTEKQEERNLRWRALLMVVIGATAMVGGVAIALGAAGLL